jgi:transcriptional regulator
MYVPSAFRQTDRLAIFEHLFSYPFATLVTGGRDGAPEANHVPLIVDTDRQVLRGHLARENPQVTDLAAGQQALAIFHGPHGYVSPSVYVEPKPSVPTWNYAVVHVRGRARTVGAPELRAILDEMVARFEPPGSRWKLDTDPEFLDRMLGGIVGFEIAIEGIDAKWKLSQNRSKEDRQAVVSWLLAKADKAHEDTPDEGDASSRALAKAMQAMELALARNTPEAPTS